MINRWLSSHFAVFLVLRGERISSFDASTSSRRIRGRRPLARPPCRPVFGGGGGGAFLWQRKSIWNPRSSSLQHLDAVWGSQCLTKRRLLPLLLICGANYYGTVIFPFWSLNLLSDAGKLVSSLLFIQPQLSKSFVSPDYLLAGTAPPASFSGL